MIGKWLLSSWVFEASSEVDHFCLFTCRKITFFYDVRSPLIMLQRLRSYSVLKCCFLKLYLTLDVSVEFWGRKRNQTWFCLSFALWIAGVQRLLTTSAGPSGPARLSAGIKMLRTLKFGKKMIPSIMSYHIHWVVLLPVLYYGSVPIQSQSQSYFS